VIKSDNVERPEVIVKLLRLNCCILEGHTQLGQLWSQLTVCTTWCLSANQNTTLVLIIVILAGTVSRGQSVDVGTW